MSVGLISFYSFISGVGSCAAFQAALKTGKPTAGPHRPTTDSYSNIELAHTPRNRNGIPSGGVWIERLLLYSDCRHCLSWQHLWSAYNALAGDLVACPCFDTFPYCRRP